MEYEISPTQTTGPNASTFSNGPRAVAAGVVIGAGSSAVATILFTQALPAVR